MNTNSRLLKFLFAEEFATIIVILRFSKNKYNCQSEALEDKQKFKSSAFSNFN